MYKKSIDFLLSWLMGASINLKIRCSTTKKKAVRRHWLGGSLCGAQLLERVSKYVQLCNLVILSFY